MNVIVSVLGKDHPGIIAAITTALAKENVNVLEVTQSIFKGNFTMMISAALPDGADFATIRDRLQTAGSAIGVEVQMQREELFSAMHSL
ncbi:ACT domain-containing protein [Lacticaseibacillus hulanensis]|uniref:ACT domain-containing protein n=1 Tax=Lacticaseibacillus hulanensis TaxID=2493111 RepID=UPI000FDBDA33|nr:ACT domain-containing protein [Lacticaseibacillus hulanensis]